MNGETSRLARVLNFLLRATVAVFFVGFFLTLISAAIYERIFGGATNSDALKWLEVSWGLLTAILVVLDSVVALAWLFARAGVDLSAAAKYIAPAFSFLLFYVGSLLVVYALLLRLNVIPGAATIQTSSTPIGALPSDLYGRALLLIVVASCAVSAILLTVGLLSVSRPVRFLGSLVVHGQPFLPLFPRSRSFAAQAAAARRSHIQAALGSLSRREEEVVEVPPGYQRSDVIRIGHLSPWQGCAQDAILDWQLRSGEPSLLFHRAGDAVRAVIRHAAGADLPLSLTLRRLPWWRRYRRRYSWIVIVGCGGSAAILRRLRALLKPLRDWIGIPLEFGRLPTVQQFKTCMQEPRCPSEYDGGTVIGMLRRRSVPQAQFGLTCGHVVPPRCRYIRIAARAESIVEPDAALIEFNNACVAQLPGRLLPVVPASPAQISEARRLKSVLTRIGGKSARVPGMIKSVQVKWPAKNGELDSMFPACEVRLRRLQYFWGLWPKPFFRKRFSVPGDSGSWVLLDGVGEQPSWIGMVQSGDDQSSYVLIADPLVRFFECAMNLPRDELAAEVSGGGQNGAGLV